MTPRLARPTATAMWSGTGGRWQLGGALHVRRSQPTLRAALLGLAICASSSSSACLLDPLAIGPGHEVSGDLDESGDELVDDGSSTSEGDGDGDPSETGDGDGEPTTDETDATDETDTGSDPCTPQGAEGQGACESLLGYAWTGNNCEPLYGCACEGTDCPEVFEDPAACWAEHLYCGPSPCAGLDEASCTASNLLCAPRTARPIVMVIDQACIVVEPAFVGCGLALPCDQVISYGCMLGQPDTPYEFPSTCLPEEGWEACEPPPNVIDPCP